MLNLYEFPILRIFSITECYIAHIGRDIDLSISCTQAATLIAVYANISFAKITGIGWRWAGVIWLYSLIFYIPLDVIKFVFHYALSGEAWNLVLDRKVGTCPVSLVLCLLVSLTLKLCIFLKMRPLVCLADSFYLQERLWER